MSLHKFQSVATTQISYIKIISLCKNENKRTLILCLFILLLSSESILFLTL